MLDHSSDERFYEYYATASQTTGMAERFRSLHDCVLRTLAREGVRVATLDVADIGCGPGAQSLAWASQGHRVHGLDVNQPLLELAKERAQEAGYVVDFRLGSASELPWPNEVMDVCLVVELLEHVAEWKPCIEECIRILKPGGVLLVTTTNKLCPIQQEFRLPMYSWYPSTLKHYYEKVATTTRPELANYAKYPAVNWFSFFSLRMLLAARGFRCFDRFDVMDTSNKGALAKTIVAGIRRVSLLRWLAHVATAGTIIVAIKARPVNYARSLHEEVATP